MLNTTEQAINKVANQANQSYLDCQRQITAASNAVPKVCRELSYIDTASIQLQAIANKAVTHLEGTLTTQRIDALKQTRLFKYIRKVDRECHHPDVYQTNFVIMLSVSLEGLLAGSLYVLDGKTGLIGGFAYGLSFALINILFAAGIGYFPLRYWLNYRHRSKRLVAILIKTLSAMAFFILTGALAVLIFSAARVRATGSHVAVFDFAEFSFWATFNDAMSLAIVALGLMGSIIAIYKGYQGISDPIPDYSMMDHYVRQTVDQPTQMLVDSTFESIDGLYDEIDGKLQQAIDDTDKGYQKQQKQLKQLQASLTRHNNLMMRLHHKIKREQQAEQFIQQQSQQPQQQHEMTADHSNIVDLHIPITDTLEPLQAACPSTAIFEDAQVHLTGTYETALADIQAAHSRYLATNPAQLEVLS